MATIRMWWDTLPSASHERRFRNRRSLSDRKNGRVGRCLRLTAEGIAGARTRRRDLHALLPPSPAVAREKRRGSPPTDADGRDPVGELDHRGDVSAGEPSG